MIDRNRRIMIEAVRKAKRITIIIDDNACGIELGGRAPREIAIALQNVFGDRNCSDGRCSMFEKTI